MAAAEGASHPRQEDPAFDPHRPGWRFLFRSPWHLIALGFGSGLPDPPGGRRRARLEETAQHGAVQLAKRAGQALLPAGDAAAGEPDQIGQVSHEISFSSGQIGSGRAA